MRYLEKFIVDDLNEKMVFIWWPRQVWKTTLSKNITSKYFWKSTYLNWDNVEHKKRILNCEYNSESEIIIFDEIHKFKNWKSFLKWEFDVKNDKFKFLITWSARLDIYQKWWDSMLWRYFYYRLHPFSLTEISWIQNDFSKWINLNFHEKYYTKEFLELQKFWWFPEIFSKKNLRSANRWKKDRIKRIIYEDIRDLNNVKDLWLLELLANILESKVWSPFSINSLVWDLQTTNKTISNWVEILEKVYFCYRIYPFHNSDLKSLKKEPKLYLWDFFWIKDIWIKNENLIANHLLKFVHFLQDVYWYDVKLNYIRDKDKREVDFAIVVDWKPKYLIEVKTWDENLSKNLIYYKKNFWVEKCFQVICWEKEIDIEKSWIRVISAGKFLSWLV